MVETFTDEDNLHGVNTEGREMMGKKWWGSWDVTSGKLETDCLPTGDVCLHEICLCKGKRRVR